MASFLTSCLVSFLLHWCCKKIYSFVPLLVIWFLRLGLLFLSSPSLFAFLVSSSFVNLISSHASSDDKLELEDKEDIVIAKDDSCNSRPCLSGIIDCSGVSLPQFQNEKMAIPTPLPKAINHVLISLTHG